MQVALEAQNAKLDEVDDDGRAVTGDGELPDLPTWVGIRYP
jgi:hypothetical protein